MRKNRGVLPLALLVLSGSLVIAGCGDKNQSAGGPPPAPAVGVVTLDAKPLTITTDLPGRTSAYRIAEVRPQVGGIILKRNYTEGSYVEAGTSLYQIDPAIFQATLNSAQADLAKTKANAEIARLTVERYKPLLGTNYVSKQDFDTATSQYAQAVAAVKAAEATVTNAKINLEYTKVTAPISGRSGKSTVTEGALVAPGQQVALTTVQQIDPIYVDVTQSSEDYLKLKNEIESGIVRQEQGKPVVHLTLTNGQSYAQKGHLEFSDVTVDESTGSITMRAIVPNPKGELLPGMFVRTKLENGIRQNAILIPQQAVIRTPRGEATTMVVNKDNVVEVRTIEVSQAVGNKWLVNSGVQVGDRVIVSGLQKAKPEMKVTPQEENLDATASTEKSEPAKDPQ
ncbi:efflux RND transporter periplasmic adaptor subunit [Proteus mirabilis]|uniref:efflux RND transporter periplasmic adaptor subunit n=1 Tax=Proteus mirabilis TaxID=584 RepID=UPI0006694F4F|nr:efflux RND transporter periplasmic adaptor subunit [Proteus mirabilis]